MKNLPFTKDQVETWVKEIPTPFYVYDEQGIADTAKDLQQALPGVEGLSRRGSEGQVRWFIT